jgi:Holliday junction resolvasome RuvABC endonuclease subunit
MSSRNQKSKKRFFNGMSYHEVQRANSENRAKLELAEKKLLKQCGCKNVGWENVVKLYQKIEEILDGRRFSEFTLEELFLEVDRIGDKYLSAQEKVAFNQKLAEAINEVEEAIDNHFPDAEIEIIDFSKRANYHA